MAHSYGYITDQFMESLQPEERILIDSEILNRLIQAENEAYEKASKRSQDKRDHPGMERYDTDEEFWDEVEDANKKEQQKSYA